MQGFLETAFGSKNSNNEYFHAIANEPLIYRRKLFSNEEVTNIKALIEKIPNEVSQTETAFNLYIQKRLETYSLITKIRIRKVLGSAEVIGTDHNSLGGACVAFKGIPLFNPSKIYIFKNPIIPKDSTLYYKLLVHEIEHYIQRIDDKLLLTGVDDKWETYFHEFGSVKAEYEFLQLIPDRLIENTKKLALQLNQGQFGRDQILHQLDQIGNGFESYRAANENYSSYESTIKYYKYFRGDNFFEDSKAVK